jgi:membrane protein YqaA with SNARE-associated domain
MNTIVIMVMLGFVLGGIIGYAIGKAQPKPNPGVGLGSIVKDAAAIATAL